MIGFAFRTCNRLGKKSSYVVTRNSSSAKPELTSVRYKVERGPYATLTESHVNFFKNLLEQNRVITDPEECEGYNIDWVKMVRGKWNKSRNKNQPHCIEN